MGNDGPFQGRICRRLNSGELVEVCCMHTLHTVFVISRRAFAYRRWVLGLLLLIPTIFDLLLFVLIDSLLTASRGHFFDHFSII